MKLTLKQRITGHIPDAPPTPTKTVHLLNYRPFDREKWQASTEHITYARELFKDPRFRDLLAVLQNARPDTTGMNVDATTAARALGWREGYDTCLSTILGLTQFPPAPPQDVPADYSSTPPEEEA